MHDTIAALSTPAGTAALAIVRVTGPAAAALATKLAGKQPAPRVVTRVDYRNRGGEVVDDVLLTFFKAPASYTGEDSVEISCHGNPLIVQMILNDLCARGCRPAEPGEFTRRAFLNGRLDLNQAEAVMELISARSEKAVRISQQHLRGALTRRVQEVIGGIFTVLARLEAYIDFPEDDLPAEETASTTRELERIETELEHLLKTRRRGELLRQGFKVVLLGEPNAGKSSLLNRLLGQERALVSPEPGTTRDYIEEVVKVGGYCARLIDTAGFNLLPSPLERRSMERSLERVREADFILLVLDATKPAPEFPAEILSLLTVDKTLILLNKSDLGKNQTVPGWPGFTRLTLSALTGENCPAVLEALETAARRWSDETGEEEIAINARHEIALADSHRLLGTVRQALAQGLDKALISSDLRAAIDHLESIVGRRDDDELLDRLFAQFCIGK